MIGPNARRRIATVADEHTGRNRSVRQFPCNPRGCQQSASMTAARDLAVSASISRSRPEPTRIGPVDLRPKAFRQRARRRAFTEGRGSMRVHCLSFPGGATLPAACTSAGASYSPNYSRYRGIRA
jgi:hypothetical protein